ncbi:MAG TPA: hypothetical protein VGO66_00230 [Solirubrobacterales bacterium]|nr:hypothetical protein [Solirubrobacterales bacterium]
MVRHSVHLSEFVCRAIAGEGDADRVSTMVTSAIRCYMDSRESAGAGWSFPGFAQESEQGAEVEVQLSIADDLWRSLEEEAEGQGVSAQQLAAHATLWFAAELDAGRITQRIIDGLNEAADEETRPG